MRRTIVFDVVFGAVTFGAVAFGAVAFRGVVLLAVACFVDFAFGLASKSLAYVASSWK